MIFYIVLFILVISLSYLYPNNKKVALFVTILLFVITAFRGETVGTDTKNYFRPDLIFASKSIETMFSDSDWLKRPELAYTGIVFAIIHYGLPFRLLVILYAVISFLSLYFVANRLKINSPVFLLCFLVLFFFPSFNISRQITAISLLLLGYTYLEEKEKSKQILFFVYVVLATLFHASSFIAMILFLFRNKYFKKELLVYIAMCLMALNAVSPINLFELLFARLEDSFYATKYAEESSGVQLSFIGLLVNYIKVILMLWVFSLKSQTSRTNLEDNIFYISIILSILTANMQSDVARIALPFSIYQIIYLTRFYLCCKNSSKCKMVFWTFILYNTFFTLYNASIGHGGVIPYVIDFKF